MKRIVFLLFTTCLALGAYALPQKEYVVVAGKSISEDTEWMNVAKLLQKKHKAALIFYKDSLEEILPALQDIAPRYVAVVEKPEALNRDYVIRLNQLSRRVDADVYEDFLWGIITGYDAQGACRMVEDATKPLVVKDAVATITELSSAKWFDTYAWIDDHEKGVWGEKEHRGAAVEKHSIAPEKVLEQFYTLYTTRHPDLVVTASHATERNLEMPYSLGNIRPDNGRLYADVKEHKLYFPTETKRKVYLPIGNCLIANINNTPESMAVGWMNNARATAMVGYVVSTWYGRGGWGALKYWLTNSGSLTLAEAVYLNRQDMLYQMQQLDSKMCDVEFPYEIVEKFPACLDEAARRIVAETSIERPTMDHVGFLYDRDVVVYYGDPKWDVRLQPVSGDEKKLSVECDIKKHKCILTVHTSPDFTMEWLEGEHFKEEHVKALPFSYFFPKPLKNVRLAAGQTWKAAVDQNCILVYQPDFKPGQTYVIELDMD